MELVTIGKILNTVGLRGEVKVFVITDFPSKRFKKGQRVFLSFENSQEYFETIIAASRKSQDRYILTFENMTAIENVQKYVGCLILIDKKAENLPKDFYYHSDLVGCAVIDESNQVIGRVSKVEDYPAHRTLRISRDEGSDVLIPFINVFIKGVNIEKKEIVVHIFEGMLWR